MTREQRNIYNEICVFYGWATASQYSALLNGETFAEQNIEALRRIAIVLKDFAAVDSAAQEMVEEINEYVDAQEAA